MIPPTDLLDFGALCLGESQWSSPGSLCPSLWFPNSAPLIAVSFSRIVAVLDGPIDSSPYPSGMEALRHWHHPQSRSRVLIRPRKRRALASWCAPTLAAVRNPSRAPKPSHCKRLIISMDSALHFPAPNPSDSSKNLRASFSCPRHTQPRWRVRAQRRPCQPNN